MALFTESTLSDSMIYAAFNNNKVMSIRISQVINDGSQIGPDLIQEQLLHIKRTRLSPLMDEVLEAYENGDILLIYSDLISIPAAVPFVVMKSGNKNKGIVFIKRYGSLNKDKTNFSINPKTLYILMEATYLSMIYYEHPERYARSSALVKTCGNIYVLMLMRILNKEYALTLDSELYSRIAYTIGRFFFDKVVEIPNRDVSHSYASSIASPTAPSILQGIKEEYDGLDIKTFDDLIESIKLTNARVSTLNKRIFIQTFMSTFGAAAVLGLDCFPYFLMTVTSTLMGCFLVNETIMSDIIKNTRGLNANTIYPELKKIV